MNDTTPLTIALATTEYVTEADFDGGLANYLHRLALSLKQLGHTPIVVVATDRDEVLQHQGITVYRVRCRRNYLVVGVNLLTLYRFNLTFKTCYNGWKLNRLLKKIHQQRNLSVIQYPSCGDLGLLRLRFIPGVIRISGYLPLWNQAYGLKRTLDIQGLENLEEVAYSRADALFCPSYLNAKAVEQVTGKPVTVIETPFVLDTTTLNYSVFEQHLAGKKYLLFFGTIGLMKGCGLIAEIIHEVLEKHPDLHFAFIGKATGYLGYKGISIMDTIREKAGSHKDRVIHLERQTHDHLYPIIANAYAVLLPSKVDNFPNTCLEAMAHKRVVIGTRGTSFEQLIEDEVNGFLCDKDNDRDLLIVTEKVLSLSEADRIAIGEKAYQRIETLQPEKVVQQLVQFYRQVIEQFNQRVPNNQGHP